MELSLLIAKEPGKMVFAFHLEAELTCLYLEGGESSSFGSFFFFVLFAEVGAEGSDLIVGSAAV